MISSKLKVTSTRAKKYHEQTMQMQCIQWFDLQFPEISRHLMHIPNGGARPKFVTKKGRSYSPEGQRLKLMGVRAGVFDLFLAIPAEPFHGLWLEAKYGKNKLSPEQVIFKSQMDKVGFKTGEFWTFEQFANEIRTYLKGFAQGKNLFRGLAQ